MAGKYRPFGDNISPGYLLKLAQEARIRHEWISLQGKVYAPTEIEEMVRKDSYPDMFQKDIKLVDPDRELARADKIIEGLIKKRNDFEKRIKKYGK